MALTERYLNTELTSGANDGTSEADAWQSWSDAIAGISPGDRLNVKRTSSTDVLGDITFDVDATSTKPIHIRAYKDSIGDGGLYEFTHNSNLEYLKFTGSALIVEGLKDKNGDEDYRGLRSEADYSLFYRCWFSAGDSISRGRARYVACVITGGAYNGNRNIHFDRCFFKALRNRDEILKIDQYFGSVCMTNSIIKSNNTTPAIRSYRANENPDSLYIVGNTFYDCSSAIYFQDLPDFGDSPFLIQGNVFHSMENYAIERDPSGNNGDSINHLKLANNFYGNCTPHNFGDLPEPGMQTISDTAADIFVDPANDDFSPAKGSPIVNAIDSAQDKELPQ